MHKQYPYQTYLKYLICVGKDPSFIRSHLAMLGFVAPSDDYIPVFVSERCGVIVEAHKIMKYVGDDPKTSTENKDAMQALADQAGVTALFKHTVGRGNPQEKFTFAQTIQILRDGHLRDIVEALLLRGLTPSELSTTLEKNHLGKYSDTAIDYYRYYFWDTQSLDRVDWKTYLSEIPDGPDKYKRMISLYYSPEYVKSKMGLTAEVAYDAMLKDITSTLYFKFKDLSKSDNPDMLLKAARLGEAAARVGEKHFNLDKDTKGGFAADIQQSLEFMKDEVPNLRDLVDNEASKT